MLFLQIEDKTESDKYLQSGLTEGPILLVMLQQVQESSMRQDTASNSADAMDNNHNDKTKYSERAQHM